MMDLPSTGLLALAADLTGQSLPEVEQLAAAMQLPVQAGGSTLNNDGSSLQLSVGLSTAGTPPHLRLLVDPASPTESGRAERALSSVLTSHAPELRSLCTTILADWLPRPLAERAALPGEGAWLAASLAGRGLALYVTTRWGPSAQRWARAARWLRTLLPERGGESAPMLERMAGCATLVSAGIEGSSLQQTRIKLYWRLKPGAALMNMGLPLLYSPTMVDFLTQVVAERQIVPGAIVGSIGFHLDSGALSDVKLDVCGHCVTRDWAEWLPIVRDCVSRFNLAAWPLDLTQLQSHAELAFIGLGLARGHSPRLNVYLKGVAPQLDKGHYTPGADVATDRATCRH